MGAAPLALPFLLVLAAAAVAGASTVAYNDRAVVIDGQRRIILSGAIHYPRSTPQMWPDLMKKAKEGGLNTIETYVFWNGHEPRRRQYNFEGNYDIVRFFKEIQNAGMYAILRIGPYICGEWNYGGLPAWLRDIPGMQFRLHNDPFERETENFTTLIVKKMKDAKMFAGQGGPIILAQETGGRSSSSQTQWSRRISLLLRSSPLMQLRIGTRMLGSIQIAGVPPGLTF